MERKKERKKEVVTSRQFGPRDSYSRPPPPPMQLPHAHIALQLQLQLGGRRHWSGGLRFTTIPDMKKKVEKRKEEKEGKKERKKEKNGLCTALHCTTAAERKSYLYIYNMGFVVVVVFVVIFNSSNGITQFQSFFFFFQSHRNRLE